MKPFSIFFAICCLCLRIGYAADYKCTASNTEKSSAGFNCSKAPENLTAIRTGKICKRICAKNKQTKTVQDVYYITECPDGYEGVKLKQGIYETSFTGFSRCEPWCNIEGKATKEFDCSTISDKKMSNAKTGQKCKKICTKKKETGKLTSVYYITECQEGEKGIGIQKNTYQSEIDGYSKCEQQQSQSVAPTSEGEACRDFENHIDDGEKNNDVCIPKKCIKGYWLDGGVCSECKMPDGDDNVISMTSDGIKCVISECKNGFVDETNNKCVEKPASDNGGDGYKGESEVNTPQNKPAKDNKSEPKQINKDAVDSAQKAYDDAKAKANSKENKILTAATTAVTSVGAMELFQGISEKKNLKEYEESMEEYIGTFRCEYGNGHVVNGDANKMNELPSGSGITGLRTQYKNLREELLAKKAVLDMSPGIETEEVLDPSEMNLYDDEFVGITGGHEMSVYSAKMGNETDAEKLDSAKESADKRLKVGAWVAGLGVVGGIMGDSLINGKIGEKIKEIKAIKNNKENDAAVDSLVKKLRENGIKVSNEDIKNLKKQDIRGFWSLIDTDKIDFKNLLTNFNGGNLSSLGDLTKTEGVQTALTKLLGLS